MIDFNEVIAEATRSAVHLEMRDNYAVDDESEEFSAWRDGARFDPNDRASWAWKSWGDLVVATAERGVVMRRARIVSEPATEYIRWEHELTAMNVAAGEQVRWLPRRRATDIALPGNDFWLFDGRLVLVNHFTGDGDFAGHEIIEDPGVVKLCGNAFETVWVRAIPHEEYKL